MQPFDIVVIGSGPAGQRAAIQAAKLGKRVALIEKQMELGGVCINTGTLPSKTLREAVLDLSGLRQRGLYGDSYRGKNEVTAADLLWRADLILKREREVIRAQLLRNHVNLLEGFGRLAGPNEVAVETPGGIETCRTEFVVIAVGTAPAVPRGMEADHQIVLTSDDILSLKALPQRLVVVGGGIIGIEYATMFAALGIDVTVIDKRTELLEMVDAEIMAALRYQSGVLGVTLRLGEEVHGIERGAQTWVQLESGKRISTDMVLISAGRQGATANLGLETAGIEADARGRITVDAHYRTSAPNIYAAGDVIGSPALASTSMEQGRLATCHAFGVEARSVPELFPYGIYAIPEIAWVGATEADLTSRGVPFETGVARYREIARGQIVGDLDGMLKLIFHLDTRRILGVWIMGTQAAELVHVGQAVMALDGTLDYFVTGVFNYPTLAECYKVAALDGYNKVREAVRAPA
ncbi:MAG: Si-specific NAD(P)(+) transhydrogenase [Candidatus Eisenbacteria bacterium]|uniref:NAD(P)(+) transhydrogenase (Si-specific) n=1 Tax=Eiseniibacteriota bacterium TaxID=2212470 RepID=A0A849SC12_UNCEI|nr:Si-specific NAD(P)(+) transhydrogenase [Candidatus Eisenbacteria bacterium]